jgi:hypothetical protein
LPKRLFTGGGLEHGWIMTFHSVVNGKIITTDELISFRGVCIPPTRYYTFIKHDAWGTYQPLSTIIKHYHVS